MGLDDLKSEINKYKSNLNINEYSKNICVDILQTCIEKLKYDNEYNSKMYDFIVNAKELVELSQNMYQIEQSIKLNKISLKGYILDSEFCEYLNNRNIHDYSIDELKAYLLKYQGSIDINSVGKALYLYELLEKIEDIENNKILFELNKIQSIFNNTCLFGINFNELNKSSLELKYREFISQINNLYVSTGFIDEKIYKYIILIINDIFNYYINGNLGISQAMIDM